ncbi:polysaccharide lyase family 8 super-sandwich domain-containing protein [Chryseobacterium sp. OSA05B]|uniref:polysaccharide lyase family 8 super-sandwich domain-containing protein n=1 Tax=Chryseobacterium sp. OSA05B TaxID=2862650 RepID=UPI001CC0600B|nr:polysaccharide lyase family 8 super-sandwich domain-containing protein [Chryseobacterium sp. OSA05B]
MKKKTLLFLIVVSGMSGHMTAQNPAINQVADHYRNWLTGENVNYNNSSVNDRYNSFKNAGTQALNLSQYDFINPGNVWDFSVDADKNEFFNITEKSLIRLVYLYKIKGSASSPNPYYNSSALKEDILKIFKYIEDKGVSASTNFEYDINIGNEEVVTSSHGIALRSSAYATSILLMKNELKAAGKFNHHMGALNGITYFLSPEFPHFNFTYPGYNSDVIRASLQQRFCYVLAQEDSEASRLNNMNHLKSFINNALLIANGWADSIKPDFITFHHRGAYSNSYGLDALHQASILNRMLKSSPYELSPVARQNLKKAILNYRTFSKDFTMPQGLAGRFPFTTASYHLLRPALAYLYIADPVENEDAGKEFIRLWNISVNANNRLTRENTVSINVIHSLGGMEDMVSTMNSGLTPSAELASGHFGFPYAGLSVHKFNGWQISVKGTSKNIWHFENGGDENRLGAYSSAGATEILTQGNSFLSNDVALLYNGWDWSHVPGTTVANVPFSILGNYGMRLMNGKNFLGHANIDKTNGVFAIDYKDANSTTGMTALKSYFFFGDKVLCLGSDIKDVGGTYPIHTTIFQTPISGTANTSIINGTVISGNNTFNANSGGLWATDSYGNGYVVPNNTYNGNQIAINRSSQTSPNQANTTSTTGDFNKAFINHGTGPQASTYQYGIQLQGGASTENFFTNFTSFFSVLKQDTQAHVAVYIPQSTYNYVIWDAATTFNFDVVEKSSKPAIIMTQKSNNNTALKISLTNPSLGLLADNESYTYSQISSVASRFHRVPQSETVTVRLSGLWELAAPNPDVSLQIAGGATELSFMTKNGFTVQASLKQASTLSTASATKEQQYQIYPNPTADIVHIITHDNVPQISVYDHLQRNLDQKVVYKVVRNKATLNLKNLPSGIYFIKIGAESFKILKK